MSKMKKKRTFRPNVSNQQNSGIAQGKRSNLPIFLPIEKTTSFLDKMVDGREFESLLKFRPSKIDLADEIRRSIEEIQSIRKRPLICYLSNVVKSNIKGSISIDNNDDLPFSEMLAAIPLSVKEIDILIVSPGGSGQQVAKFVDKLRPRFDKVSFILPNMAMSAATIWVMSGDEIIMDSRAYIGPVDPQIPNKDGQYIPAQAIITIIEEIQKKGDELLKKGQNPPWTDLQILRQIDAREIGNAINASKYSVELVENYLFKYKFKSWIQHKDGSLVSDLEKQKRAKDIAICLCNHGLWKTHSRGINREIAWDICQLKITSSESILGLERVIRRFWALVYWIFENTTVFKIFISDNYCIFRHDVTSFIRKNEHE